MAVFAFFGGLALQLFGFVPFFYGARSLSLGQGTLARNYDVNAVHLNPALLSNLSFGLSGVQYQHQYFDYKNFGANLAALLGHDLKNWDSLPSTQRAEIWGGLGDLFRSKVGISGFQGKNTGFAFRDFGMMVSQVDEAVIYPLANPVLGLAPESVTAADIAGLKMDFLGWHYMQYSLSYSLPLTQSVNIGATLHYLKGQVSDFSLGLIEPQFSADQTSRDYLVLAWDRKETDFSRITLDLGAAATFGRYFSIGVVGRNMLNAEIQTARRTLPLQRRVIAGLAFQSQDYWGIYLDLDVKRLDFWYNGKESQPISLGVEKGFFGNLFSVRAGFLNDLTEEDFLGKQSNILYGLGLGFNQFNFQVDLALGINALGKIKSLAISGFFLMQRKN